MDIETFERETASFEVELSHADVEGVWQKDGLRVKPNNNWRVSCNGRVHCLTLSNLTLEDTGSIVFSAEGLRTTARLVVKGGYIKLILKTKTNSIFPSLGDLNFYFFYITGKNNKHFALHFRNTSNDH